METAQIVFHRADGAMLTAVDMAAGARYEIDVPEGSARLSLTWPVVPSPSVLPPSREDLPAFRAHVLRWLREEQGFPAASVEKVAGYGTDWAGDTAGGFYAETEIEVEWTDESGKKHHKTAMGDDFMSLWHWVVDVWPEPTAEAPQGT